MLLNKTQTPSKFQSPSDGYLLPNNEQKHAGELSQIEVMQLFDNLLEIILKDPANRTQQDETIISRALQSIQVFANGRKEELDFHSFLLQNFNSMEHEHFEAGEAIFHYSDKGDKFYIVLKGFVDVYTPKTNEEILNEISSFDKKEPSHHVRRSQMFHNEFSPHMSKPRRSGHNTPTRKPEYINSKDKDGNDEMNELKSFMNTFVKPKAITPYYVLSTFSDKHHMYIENGICKFKKVRNMGPGTYFGEIALSSNLSRGATIVASTDLHLAVLKKAAYKQVCKNVESGLKMKWRFFSELLDGTSKEALTKFCYSFKERTFKYNQKIFEEGDSPREVFVIRQGEVQVVKQQVEEDEQNNIKYFRKQKKISEHKIVNLGPFTFFGEGEALTLKPYRYTAISMTSDTIIYSTSIQDFNLLRMNHAEVISRILKKHNAKMEHWNTRSVSNIVLKNDESGATLNSPPKLLPERTKGHYLSFHSPKSLEKKIRKSPNTESIEKTIILPITETNQSMDGDSSDLAVSLEKIKKKKDIKTKTESLKIYEKIKEGNLLNNDEKLQKLFPNKKELYIKAKDNSKTSFREKEKALKSLRLLENGSFDESDSSATMVIQRLKKKGLMAAYGKKEEPENKPKPENFLPYEKDAQRFKLKAMGLVTQRKIKESRNNSQNEESLSLMISNSLTERQNITARQPKDTSVHRVEIKPKGPNEANELPLKYQLDLKLFMNMNESTEHAKSLQAEYFESSLDHLPKSGINKYPFRKPQIIQDDLPSPKSKISSRNQDWNQILPMNMLPLIDVNVHSPGASQSLTKNSGRTRSHPLELRLHPSSSSDSLLPKVNSKKPTIVSSKHNLFRQKPQKSYIEYSYYATSIDS